MSLILDPRFVDADLAEQAKQLGYVPGELPSPEVFAAGLGRYEDAAPVHPESQWRDMVAAIEAADGGKGLGVERLVTRIYDQASEGSCVANACAQAHEVTQAKQFGRDKVVHLSAISLYKRIGRSPGSGAMVSDGMEEARDRGILPLDAPENGQFAHRMANTGFRTPFQAGWEETAKSFRYHEYYIGQTVAELMSAGINGDVAIIGRSGHSIMYARPTWIDAWLYGYANSWRLSWGQAWGEMSGGFGFDSMRYIRSSAGYAVIVRSVTVPKFQQ